MIFIVLASAIAYAAMGMLVARRRFAATRPYAEPLSCATPDWDAHVHREDCYLREGVVLIDTDRTAAVAAAGMGLIWWVYLAWVAAQALALLLLRGSGRELPAERDAAVARMEHELGMDDGPRP